ncbi:unnamed protein product [Lactuca virosa]|uniref:Uncharacterized protein n=1 Tax=Lactuca virosa TaxID=75947 RepID=A0AAU9MTZ5_9ASTR|nr:unnamed protein product [Lactuca virosa]
MKVIGSTFITSNKTRLLYSDSKGNLDSAIPTIGIRREKRGINDKINLPEISSDVEVEMFRLLLQKPIKSLLQKPDRKLKYSRNPPETRNTHQLCRFGSQ